ncbi:NAD(P)/FAD-dependent oxidoreductase [Rhodococcus sp. X156]|uniref:flavin-containing monooxygenase n=1 Tax=Rhodococcus sp. X156 TaxID=2499145 RepID=UPI000FD9048F|nr:NAD(P)/FAD-dependent oxidoreductase [Rhodococcus sp. X156]
MNQRQPTYRKPTALIIGTGFGGIAAAIEIGTAGYDYTVLEKADDVGGVWRENTYPGAGCDIPSPLYSFSYDPNPEWPKRFSLQPDILAYLQRTATKHGVRERTHFGVEVTSAEFDAAAGQWRVHTSTGETFSADVLVPAVGQLSRPAMPRIPGIDTFTGHSFHSARWDHSRDLTGDRVAVIGTGASAVQLVPQIQPRVSHLSLFQRSAPFVLPRPDRTYTRAHHAAFRRLPTTQLLGRGTVWALAEAMTLGFTTVPALGAAIRQTCLTHLRMTVRDKTLRAKLTPGYPVGCKRVLFSSNYLPALTQRNVEVVTDAITEITPRGVRTADGAEHEVDTIIYGTGFTATEFLAPMTITGLDGQQLSEHWRDGARAYLGMTVPGFPNLFLMYGPNTNLGAGSIVYMQECQARYLRQAMRRLEVGGPGYLDVRPEVEERFDAEIQGRVQGGVWTLCDSWYRNPSGRVTANWPGRVAEYRDRTEVFDADSYRHVSVDAPVAVA